ncbi:hypothetical protein IWW42_004855 [Coemansia sp. RSA 1085]|nr:hypothetical protein IWW42_004855 [Coemansia sp. RSA 1085]
MAKRSSDSQHTNPKAAKRSGSLRADDSFETALRSPEKLKRRARPPLASSQRAGPSSSRRKSSRAHLRVGNSITDTAIKASTGHSRSMGTAPSSQQGTLRREKKEAPELRESYLRDNIDDVIAIAAPSDGKLQQQAHNYAETISLLLSRLLSNDIEGESYNIISRCLENEGEDEYATTSTLDENAAGGKNRRSPAAQERPMYPDFLALLAFVTGCIGWLSSSAGNPFDDSDTFQQDDASDNIVIPKWFDKLSYRRLCAGHFASWINWGTIQHGCMEIDVALPGNGDGTGKQTFYSCEVITVAERVFGRHTRCFIAHRDPASAIERVKVAKNGIIIKDAWPEAAEHAKDDDRDEARYLRKIHEELPGDRYDGMYPEFLEGGRVHLGNEDTTQQFVGDSVWRQLNEHAEREGEQMALRVHKRIAMKGIGKPLKTINNCLELIIVVADVMNCHNGIVEHCNILHRDISTANILARDTADGIGGMLIDFDMAVDVDRKGNAVRTERTGTYPFMSVGNLEGSLHNRTALDGWESLLYILCWLGTYGWNTATSCTDINELEIND